MSHDTRALNNDRRDIASLDEIWLFGYGSLIYKVDFPTIDAQPAYLEGWQRRFWQGSHDHRGTPEAPGRVLTLIEAPGKRCFGIAYRVALDVFDHLDHREKNGYVRKIQPLLLANGLQKSGVFYIGLKDSPAHLGPAPDDMIARQIFTSEGPSGTNREYLFKLCAALHAHGEVDDHVMRIEELVKHLADGASA
jgi:glutathione-specific gamma-glutamylcyclotransferase